MTIEQFWNGSFKDFQLYVIAHEREQLYEWQRTRSIAYMTYVTNAGKHPKSIEQFWRLPSDQPEEPVKYATDEEIQKRIKELTHGN